MDRTDRTVRAVAVGDDGRRDGRSGTRRQAHHRLGPHTANQAEAGRQSKDASPHRRRPEPQERKAGPGRRNPPPVRSRRLARPQPDRTRSERRSRTCCSPPPTRQPCPGRTNPDGRPVQAARRVHDPPTPDRCCFLDDGNGGCTIRSPQGRPRSERAAGEHRTGSADRRLIELLQVGQLHKIGAQCGEPGIPASTSAMPRRSSASAGWQKHVPVSRTASRSAMSASRRASRVQPWMSPERPKHRGERGRDGVRQHRSVSQFWLIMCRGRRRRRGRPVFLAGCCSGHGREIWRR